MLRPSVDEVLSTARKTIRELGHLPTQESLANSDVRPSIAKVRTWSTRKRPATMQLVLAKVP
jgi:hypothetical protein